MHKNARLLTTLSTKLLTTLLVTLLFGGLLTGCFTMNASMPGALRSDLEADDVDKVGTLAIETTHLHILWGLVGKPDAEVFSAEIRKQVAARGGDGVVGLTYDADNGPLGCVVGSCTAGCVTPRTYKIGGDIVRIKKAPLPGKSVLRQRESAQQY